MNLSEKMEVARALQALKVDVIEAGFPISSPGDFESVKTVASEIRGPSVAGLARANDKDIDRCWEAVQHSDRPRIHTFIATSDIHIEKKLKKTREDVIALATRAVARAKGYCDDVEFSAEDATRSDPDYLCEVFKAAIEAGASTINVPDTVGYTVPREYYNILSHIKEHVPGIENVVLSVHCHNDLGMAVANSLAAIRAGARQVECTINGIGERAGNTSMEEVVMILRTRQDILPYSTQIVTEQIYPASRLLSQITGIPVQPNKAVVGANAFAHEAGIHQDGVLKEKRTYEIMTPESIGLSKSSLVLGKHSGRHAFRERLKELGYELTDENLDKAFKSFKSLADKKKDIYDEDLEAIIADEILRIPDKYKLVYLNISCGTVSVPTATVQMEIDGKLVQEAGFGDGPVDATYKTIKAMVKSECKLVRYVVKAITGGTDAQGEVTVSLEEGGKITRGQGAHTDILVASAKAFINALNKLEYRKRDVTHI